jgi:hypothetical protein
MHDNDGGEMKRILAAVFLATLAPLSCAGEPPVAIAVPYEPAVPAVRLQMPADFVALPVNMQCNLKDPVKRVERMEEAMRTLTAALAKTTDLEARLGVISLAETRTSYSFMSREENSDVSTARLYVLAPLKPGGNLLSATRHIYRTMQTIEFGGDIQVDLGETVLAMSDPEKYRPQLLSAIPKSIAEARKALGAPLSYALDGVQNPVSVMQLNERDVLLFINYRLSVQGHQR